MGSKSFTFNVLIEAIRDIHHSLSAQTAKAVNISLTLRNWLIGMYVADFQLRGVERAKYGENLFTELSRELKKQKISGCGRRQLYNYLAFYRAYPHFVRTLPAQLKTPLPAPKQQSKKVRTPSAQLQLDPGKLLSHLLQSF